MEYTDDFLKRMVQMGTLGYSVSKIVNVLDVEDEKQFADDLSNPDHAISKAYRKGMDKADFILDSKLFEMAKNGDMQAIKKYEERKQNNLLKRNFEHQKNKT